MNKDQAILRSKAKAAAMDLQEFSDYADAYGKLQAAVQEYFDSVDPVPRVGDVTIDDLNSKS